MESWTKKASHAAALSFVNLCLEWPIQGETKQRLLCLGSLPVIGHFSYIWANLLSESFNSSRIYRQRNSSYIWQQSATKNVAYLMSLSSCYFFFHVFLWCLERKSWKWEKNIWTSPPFLYLLRILLSYKRHLLSVVYFWMDVSCLSYSGLALPLFIPFSFFLRDAQKYLTYFVQT